MMRSLGPTITERILSSLSGKGRKDEMGKQCHQCTGGGGCSSRDGGVTLSACLFSAAFSEGRVCGRNGKCLDQ